MQQAALGDRPDPPTPPWPLGVRSLSVSARLRTTPSLRILAWGSFLWRLLRCFHSKIIAGRLFASHCDEPRSLNLSVGRLGFLYSPLVVPVAPTPRSPPAKGRGHTDQRTVATLPAAVKRLRPYDALSCQAGASDNKGRSGRRCSSRISSAMLVRDQIAVRNRPVPRPA